MNLDIILESDKNTRKYHTEESQEISHFPAGDHKVSKGAKIRNRYNQVPHLTQDTNGKVKSSQLDTKASRNRQNSITKTNTNTYNT